MIDGEKREGESIKIVKERWGGRGGKIRREEKGEKVREGQRRRRRETKGEAEREREINNIKRGIEKRDIVESRSKIIIGNRWIKNGDR